MNAAHTVGTPGRRSPATIAKAVRAARKRLQSFADAHNLKLMEIVRSRRRIVVKIVITELAPITRKFGVTPKTLIRWISIED